MKIVVKKKREISNPNSENITLVTTEKPGFKFFCLFKIKSFRS